MVSVRTILAFLLATPIVGILSGCTFLNQELNAQPNKDISTEMRKAFINAYNNQDWEKVVFYGKAIEENGDSIGDLTLAYAQGLCLSKDYDNAQKLVLDRIEKHPEDHLDYLYCTLAGICYFKGKENDALIYYSKAAEINPYYARAFIGMAEIYREQGKTKQAAENYLKAIDLFYNHGAFNESEFFSQQIIEIDKYNLDAHIYLAATYYKSQMASEYELYLKKAVKIGGSAAKNRIQELVK